MPLISSKTIITSLSLFHITLGYFFITSPRTIADQALVYIVGESMGMPDSRNFDSPSPALAFLGAILCIIGLSDLVSLSMPEEVCLVHHWGTQAPLRVFIGLVLTLYTFLTSPSSPIYRSGSRGSRLSHPSAHAHNQDYRPSAWGGDALKNRIFFTFMFVQTLAWFWVWVTLREERSQLAQRKAKRRMSHSHQL